MQTSLRRASSLNLLAVALVVLLSRPSFGQARVVSAPAEPSLLNLTSGWGRASTLGDLRELRTRSDYLELRVWRGFGPSETQSVVLRRVDGHWSASLARVIRCEIQIPNSAGDTASQATMRRYAAEARRTCGASVIDVRAGMRILATDTLVVQRLDVSESDIETAWKDAVSAGVLELPGRVKRSETIDDGITYVIELRRGDEYRAAEIEHVERPELKTDMQVQEVYAAVRRLLERASGKGEWESANGNGEWKTAQPAFHRQRIAAYTRVAAALDGPSLARRARLRWRLSMDQSSGS